MKYFAIFDENVATIFELQWNIGNISDIFLQYLCYVLSKYNFYGGIWNQNSYTSAIRNLDIKTTNLVKWNLLPTKRYSGSDVSYRHDTKRLQKYKIKSSEFSNSKCSNKNFEKFPFTGFQKEMKSLITFFFKSKKSTSTT